MKRQSQQPTLAAGENPGADIQKGTRCAVAHLQDFDHPRLLDDEQTVEAVVCRADEHGTRKPRHDRDELNLRQRSRRNENSRD